MSGPSTPARPAVPAQMPIALPRSSGGNTLVMIDSVAGMMNAPPMPMNARVDDQLVGRLDANAEASEPRPNTTSPTCSAPRRPNLSPRLPAVSSRPANTSVYESTIHCSWLFGGVELAHDRGDRDVEDRVVEDDHEQAEAQDREDQPAPFVGVVPARDR